MAWTYILRCRDGSYYTGSTINLERRLWEHNESPDLGAAYTRRRRPVTLAWCAEFSSIAAAYFFEKQVQGWTRRKKESLMRDDFDALVALARRKGVQERELAEAFRALEQVGGAT
ncbi:GIY-YIG nuclease family protein [Nocardioides sp.]|uniref:GIY-YIG nuclease family protein n=1 Tax=Nocardioides sp. TaxID=35761 RepID=UPI00271F8B4C|nr:GIY-YIG nuclease family protein [Nocardioides sp.]MDO9455781.1 GIY-YIG nuclease family protein [Nocardioides sp.]